MKKLFAALMVTMFTTGAFATSIDRTPVIARADGFYAGLKTVALLADGRMQLVGEDGKLLKQFFLGEKAFAKLTRDVEKVANVEVKTVTNQFVCMTLMAVMPDTLSDLSVAKYDYEKASFEGKPRLVLTARGCYLRSTTAPVVVSSLADAAGVREELVLLALANLD